MQHAASDPAAHTARRGDVLARKGKHAVVWRQDGPHRLVWLLPIEPHLIPRHRGDVLIDDPADMVALGVGGRCMMIRAGHPVGRAPCDLGALVGHAPPTLMTRLAAAYAQARQAAGYEAAHAIVAQGEQDMRDAWG